MKANQPPAKDANAILRAAEMNGERFVNHIRLVFALLGVVATIGAWSINTYATNVIFAVQSGGWLIYSALLYLSFRLISRRYVGWLKYLTITLDLVLLSLSSLAMAANHSGILEFFIGLPPLWFAFWALLSGFRFSLPATIYATSLTIVLNGLVLSVAVSTGAVAVSPTSLYGTPAINIGDQVMAIIFISLPGILGGIIAQSGRRLVLRAAMESQQRMRLEGERDRLGKYLSRDLVEMVLQNPGRMELGGSRRVATIMFTDIRNFTPFSEKREPEEVVRFLNRYFTVMAEVVFRHRGTLDKYLGDGLLAEFGIPFAIARSPLRAVVGALEMMHALRTLNEEMGGLKADDVEIGVGIATGPVVAGNIGSPERMEYTCIGDTVNTAARLEKLNRELGTDIIIDEDTQRAVVDVVPTRSLPAQRVKGKQEELKLYAVDVPDDVPALLAGLKEELDRVAEEDRLLAQP